MKSLLVALLLAGLPGVLVAQGVAPRPALPDLPASVRVAGFGGAGVALPGYAASVFDNPANLGPIRTLSIEGAFARLPDRSLYGAGAAAVRVGDFNFGGGLRELRYEGLHAVRNNVSWVGAATYRVQGIALGTSTKFISVEDSSGTVFRTLTSDLGVTLAFFDIAALAISFQNLGRYALSGEQLDLPSGTRLGFSMNLIDTYSNGRLLATFETDWTNGASRRTVVGLEAGAVFRGVGVVGRIGTGAPPPGTEIGKTSYGASLVLSRARIDYAYQQRSAIGRSVHLFGLRWTP